MGIHEDSSNQGRLFGRGREGQALKAGKELETDGKSNTMERTVLEPQTLEGGSVRKTELGGGQWI